MRVLPRVDSRLGVRVLVDSEETVVRDLPQLRSSGHACGVDVATVARIVGRPHSGVGRDGTLVTERQTDAPARQTVSPATQSVEPATPPRNSAGRGRERRPTRLSSLHVGLLAAAVLLVLLVVFLAQNSHTVEISFLGAHLHVSLAVAMLAAAVAGALIVGGAGAARVGQMRRRLRSHVRSNENRALNDEGPV